MCWWEEKLYQWLCGRRCGSPGTQLSTPSPSATATIPIQLAVLQQWAAVNTKRLTHCTNQGWCGAILISVRRIKASRVYAVSARDGEWGGWRGRTVRTGRQAAQLPRTRSSHTSNTSNWSSVSRQNTRPAAAVSGACEVTGRRAAPRSLPTLCCKIESRLHLYYKQYWLHIGELVAQF